jgi:hypothetical protein
MSSAHLLAAFGVPNCARAKTTLATVHAARDPSASGPTKRIRALMTDVDPGRFVAALDSRQRAFGPSVPSIGPCARWQHAGTPAGPHSP